MRTLVTHVWHWYLLDVSAVRTVVYTARCPWSDNGGYQPISSLSTRMGPRVCRMLWSVPPLMEFMATQDLRVWLSLGMGWWQM